MSKKDSANTEVKEQAKVVEENTGRSTEELKEIANTLRTQLQHHQTMAVKAQGALEVIIQMLPQEEEQELQETENK